MSTPPQVPENDLVGARQKKADAICAAGGNPYPDADAFRPTLRVAEFRARYEATSKEDLEKIAESHRLAGRILQQRRTGKLVFAPMRDGSGQVQLMISKGDVTPETWALFDSIDMGDYVGVEGVARRTNKGELSLFVKGAALLSKTIRPLPEKWHGLTDKETRYRQRYVDLIANPEVGDVFRMRSRIVRGIRNFLEAKGLLEVETPMMHPLAGGAAARPFVTKHNALGLELYMRIAPELYLKRLVVGGLDGVYEINRNFRNEGMDLQHNPEFTMLEFYVAYKTYRDLMDWTEELISGLAQELHGKTALDYHYDLNDREKIRPLDFKRPWKRITIHQSVADAIGVPRDQLRTLDQARAAYDKTFGKDEDAIAKRDRILKSTAAPEVTAGHLVYAIFEEKVEPTLIQPTFVHDFPIAVSPLARRSDRDPTIADRFELFIAGREIANAFSELNDPRDQEARFKAQMDAKKGGDDEAMPYDADYVRALEYGLPPCAGEGIGIDRLVMLLTDQASIRDVILFPLMRPER
jgi:lysyl-tRNA synthetase class 2